MIVIGSCLILTKFKTWSLSGTIVANVSASEGTMNLSLSKKSAYPEVPLSDVIPSAPAPPQVTGLW